MGSGRLAAGGGLLAVETDVGRVNIARASCASNAARRYRSGQWYIRFAKLYTGQHLAFISLNSGTNAVWIAKPGARPAMLFDAGAASLFRVNFSPDGSRLAIVLFFLKWHVTARY